MNKKLLYLLPAVLLVAAACNSKVSNQASVNTQSQGQSDTGQNQSQSQVQSQSQTSANVSLKDLLATHSNQKCTFSESTANTSSQGTVYIASGKMRGDFSSTVSGKTNVSHMVSDSQNMNVWVDGQTQGFKMSLKATSNNSMNSNMNSHQSVNPDTKYNYSCSSWVADNSMFTLPANITFTDFSSLQLLTHPK
jgi:hypothetical protein